MTVERRLAALILADGAVPPRAVLDAAWPGWDDGIALVVAADGGARHAAPLGVRVDRWVGDGDSVDPALLEALAVAGAERSEIRAPCSSYSRAGRPASAGCPRRPTLASA